MSRLDKSNDQPIYLFPFFSILVCILGSLLLIGGTIIGFSLDVSGIVTTNAKVEEIKGGHVKVPVYIEWDGKEIVIHPERNKVPLYIKPYKLVGGESFDKIKVKIAAQIERTLFEALLRCIQRQSNKKYLVVMVRPSGFENFLYLREFILQYGIDIGYEAMGQHWNLLKSGERC